MRRLEGTARIKIRNLFWLCRDDDNAPSSFRLRGELVALTPTRPRSVSHYSWSVDGVEAGGGGGGGLSWYRAWRGPPAREGMP